MIKNSFQIFATQTSMHGFAELYSTKTFCGKVIWMVILAAAFGLTSYQFYGVIKNFLDEPTSTVILPADEDQIVYPPLSICQVHWMHWVDWVKATQLLNISRGALLFGINYIHSIYSSEVFDVNEAHGNFIRVMNENNFTTIFQFYKTIIKDLPIKADHNLSSYFDQIEIVYKDGGRMVCYKMSGTQISNYFASNKNLKEKWITFTTFDDAYERVLDFMSNEEYNIYAKKWIEKKSMYKVRPENELKNFTTFAPPIFILPNTFNNKGVDIYSENDVYTISLQAAARTLKNRSKHSCTNMYQAVAGNDTCKIKCESMIMKLSCSCLSLELAVISNDDRPEKLCHRGITFITPHRDRIASTGLQNYSSQTCPFNDETLEALEKCKSSCTPSCSVWTYETSVSIAKMESFIREIGKKTTTNISIEYPIGNRIMVMTEVDTETWDTFIGNVGGVLGIWTGASVLSFIQIFYLCFCASRTNYDSKV